MFKYLWIIMLVIGLLIFIVYSAWCFRECVIDEIVYYEKHHEKESPSVRYIFEEALHTFSVRYEVIHALLVVFIMCILIGLFVASLVCFTSAAFPAE